MLFGKDENKKPQTNLTNTTSPGLENFPIHTMQKDLAELKNPLPAKPEPKIIPEKKMLVNFPVQERAPQPIRSNPFLSSTNFPSAPALKKEPERTMPELRKSIPFGASQPAGAGRGAPGLCARPGWPLQQP